jgi:muconolactone D-isomerase
MLFMVDIIVRMPGDWPEERVAALVQAETARGLECIEEGKLKRVYRVVGRRANFSIWEADSLEELHETLTSLPMHPYMDLSVHPIIKHGTTAAWEAAHGSMPLF